ncbi:MAG: hypothetical protein HY264_11795 [Chloroflexi bacterium]|nr:hypothetical protein [Chloroflexota bacterium]
MPERLPPPGPSYLREQELRLGDRVLHVGMSRPSDGPDGWWLAILWVHDETGVISFRELAPAAGPPPEPPLARLGPSFAGGLSGLILEEGGRLSIRLGALVPPDPPDRPWRCPVAIRAGFRWEPTRLATIRPNALALEVQTAFRRAVEGLVRH